LRIPNIELGVSVGLVHDAYLPFARVLTPLLIRWCCARRTVVLPNTKRIARYLQHATVISGEEGAGLLSAPLVRCELSLMYFERSNLDEIN
jgi:hypothetical protein